MLPPPWAIAGDGIFLSFFMRVWWLVLTAAVGVVIALAVAID